jgi:hypothetical protein
MPIVQQQPTSPYISFSGLLVGDIIIGARELFPDLPRGLAIPSNIVITAAQTAVPSSLPPGQYYLIFCFTNQWGQTLGTAEAGPVTVDAAHSILVSGPLISACPGATGANVYYGPGSGGECQFISITSLPVTISAPGIPAIPPTRNTSFYPDADGQRVSAYTVYRWLNTALEQASKIVGGIPDMTGIPTINEQAMYQIPGLWTKIDHGWWDGYAIALGGRDTLFYRNVVPGVVRIGVLQQAADKIIVELQPQPDRSGEVTTLANPALATDTTLTLTDVSGFKLPFGMLLLGALGSSYEVCAFSTISGNVLGGVQRGLGGTVPQAWNAGLTASEANLRLAGLRIFNNPTYTVGMGALSLPIPAGWRDPLIDYLVGRFREATNNLQEYRSKMQSFERALKDYARGNKLVAGPRQIGTPGSGGLDTWPAADNTFGIIVP